MTTYVNTQTLEYPITEQGIRSIYKDTSFGSIFKAPDEFSIVFESPKPEHNPVTQTVREIAPVFTNKGHWEQQWEVVALDTETVAVNQAAKAAADREAAKAARATAVENIKVTTTAGNTFDGDETAQTRMARAVLVLSTGAAASVPWVLADNTVIQADIAELTEALALAGAEQAQLWVL